MAKLTGAQRAEHSKLPHELRQPAGAVASAEARARARDSARDRERDLLAKPRDHH